MTAQAFSTIALLMSVCIMWGMVLSVFFNKRYLGRLGGKKTGTGGAGFGDIAMTAMFIGLVSAYIGSYIGTIVSGNGLFTFTGNDHAAYRRGRLGRCDGAVRVPCRKRKSRAGSTASPLPAACSSAWRLPCS